MSFDIPILMHELLTPDLAAQIAAEPDRDPFETLTERRRYYGPSGRQLLSAALASLNLTRHDEIAILTTSGETYVTTCVSATAFNFGRISRVVSGETRVVIVIHEFGYVWPECEKQIDAWRSAGIVVIEDCAHVIGIKVGGKSVGAFGDYAFFSFPKVTPLPSGGVLFSRRAHPDAFANDEAARVQRSAERFLPKFEYFNRERVRRAELIRSHIRDTPAAAVTWSETAAPCFQGILLTDKQGVMERFPEVEWGATLRPDLLYFPTNPLVPIETFERVSRGIAAYATRAA